MNIPSCLSIAALTAVLCASAAGQAPTIEKVPLPSGPLLERTAAFSKWTITVFDKGGSANETATAEPPGTQNSSKPGSSNGPKVVVTVTKTTPILLVSTVGKSENSTVWCVGAFQVRQDAEYKKPVIFNAASHVTAYVDYSKTDFPEIQWITEKNFVGIQKAGDQQYLVFRDEVSNTTQDNINRARAVATALKRPFDASQFSDAREVYIDSQTRMPVFWRKGVEYHVYKFMDPPTAALSLPSDIRSMVDDEQQRLKDLARRPPSG